MVIRKRLTYVFTFLTGSIVLMAFFVVFVFSQSERSDYFYERLSQRITITEQFFLEQEGISESVKLKIKENFNHKLPSEIELVVKKVELKDSITSSSWRFLSTEILEIAEEGLDKSFFSNGYYCSAVFHKYKNEEYIILVAAKDIEGELYLNKLRFWMILICLLSIVLAFILSRMLAKRILQPIARKIEKANQISVNNLSDRLQVFNPDDEIGMLANSFNQLLERLEVSFLLQQNFVRYASHELKNPLSVIIGESDIVLTKERTRSEYEETIKNINLEADKLNRLVNQFLFLSETESSNLDKVDLQLDELIFEIIGYYSRQNSNIKITFNIGHTDEDLGGDRWQIKGIKDLLNTAFQNAIENAIKYSNGMPIGLTLNKNNHKITLSIIDEGMGVNPLEAEHLFQPLFRSAKTQDIKGSGIGLSIVKNIVKLHNGVVSFDTNVSKGAKLDIVFFSSSE